MCKADLNSRDGSLGDEVIQVEVSNQTKFAVHKNLLCYYSPNFRAALKGGFREGIENKLELEDVAERTFKLFLEWLYFQTLPNWDVMDENYGSEPIVDYESCEKQRQKKQAGNIVIQSAYCGNGEESDSELDEEHASDPEDYNPEEELDELRMEAHIASLSPAHSCYEEKLRPSLSPQDFDAFYRLQPEAELVDLYIFAEEYDVPSLRNNLMSQLSGSTPDERPLPSFAVVIKAYDNLPSESPLCQYLVETYAALYKADRRGCRCEECSIRESLPIAFLLSVMMAISRNQKETIPLSRKGRCFYFHQHANEKDALACPDRNEDISMPYNLSSSRK